MSFLISPSEPATIQALGPTSPFPETCGADVVVQSRVGLAGVQRKEVGDLVGSVRSGRLGDQLTKMTRLSIRVLVIEGRLQWSRDGQLMGSHNRWTRAEHRGLLWSLQQDGVWICTTDDMADTCDALVGLKRYLDKPGHGSIYHPPKQRDEWFKFTERSTALSLLTRFPGVGPRTAEAIYDRFGRVPLGLNVEPGELAEVEGMGPKRVRAILDVLGERCD